MRAVSFSLYIQLWWGAMFRQGDLQPTSHRYEATAYNYEQHLPKTICIPSQLRSTVVQDNYWTQNEFRQCMRHGSFELLCWRMWVNFSKWLVWARPRVQICTIIFTRANERKPREDEKDGAQCFRSLLPLVFPSSPLAYVNHSNASAASESLPLGYHYQHPRKQNRTSGEEGKA